MEAKDTVMPKEGRIILSYMNPEIVEATITELLNKQAEVSFKAGQQSEREKLNYCDEHKLYYCDCCPDCFKKVGIKEVVEWSNEKCPHDIQELSQSGLYTHRDMPEKKCECPLCWQAKLKEWGI